jgi:hypothetical protein
MVKEDRPLAADIEVVAKMVSDGSLLETVESSVAKLGWFAILLLCCATQALALNEIGV